VPPPGGGAPGQLAEWQDRLVSGLIDYIGPFILGSALQTFSGGFVPGMGGFGGLYFAGFGIQILTLAWALYNGYLAGTTGQSFGMKQSGLRLVSEANGQVIGGNQGLVRNLILIPGLFCCGLLTLIDALFPLWDPKKQTLRDKIAHSVVIKA